MKIFPISFLNTTFLISLVVFSAASFADGKGGAKGVETLSEVSIIGNSELPNVSFDIPWQLPTIEKREDQSPPKTLQGILQPIEPKRFRQELHFSKYLEVEAPIFNAR